MVKPVRARFGAFAGINACRNGQSRKYRADGNYGWLAGARRGTDLAGMSQLGGGVRGERLSCAMRRASALGVNN